MKVKPSDVLWTAANKFLAANIQEYNDTIDKRRFSCDAISAARYELSPEDDSYVEEFLIHELRLLGCDTGSTHLFNEFEKEMSISWHVTEESQGARYIWLILAATYLEDEGM